MNPRVHGASVRCPWGRSLSTFWQLVSLAVASPDVLVFGTGTGTRYDRHNLGKRAVLENGVKGLRTLFGTVMAAAEGEEGIPSNPVRKTRFPRRGPVTERAVIAPEKIRFTAAKLSACPYFDSS
jgi:hypothetical protein